MAASSAVRLDFLPRSLRKALLNFQKKGVRFGISKQGRCLIGDEMGLGKTLQAISIAYYYKDAWPLLIVVPSSVKFSWIDEIEKWLPEVEPHNINLIRSGSDISNLGKAIIHVIGYGLLSVGTSKLLLQALESQKFNVVILDESHYLKTRKAARTKRLHQLCKKAKHAILLSGTPSLARPRELYFQLDIVCPGKFGSFSSFVKRFCDAHDVYYRGERRYDTSGASNLNELYQLLKTHVMIRRLKKEVLTQLPPKRRQKVTFDISESPSQYKKELQQVLKDFKKCSAILKGEVDDPSIQSPMFEMNRLSIKLYHCTGLVKIGPVLKYIEDLAQGMDSKFIVFFRHRVVGKAIVQKLVTLKLKHIWIAGDVLSGIRGDLVRSFQTDPQVRIAVLSIEAASFGLTLTAAHHVVFAELHHTPGVIIQAEDRAHRIGQTLPVNVHYLIARGTVDEILWGMIRRKVYVTSSTLDGVCKELKAEDGDADQARQLSACAAWVQDQEEGTDELEEFVMEQLSSKTSKQDHSQRDLRSFFTPAPSPSTSQLINVRHSPFGPQEESSVGRSVEHSTVRKSSIEVISVLDSGDDDDDMPVWDDVEDDALMSVSLAAPEEREIEEHKQSTMESLHSDSNVDGESKPVTRAERGVADDEHCPLKPKTLKFKKEKDGKLSFGKRKKYTKVHDKETHCKASPLKIVGNDPETESQTLQSYLDDDYEPVVVKAEQKEEWTEKFVSSRDDYRQNDRGFLASLQEADIECVAVVCKKASSIAAQGKNQISGQDSALEASEQEADGIDDQEHEVKQDLCDEESIVPVKSDLQKSAYISERAISNASNFDDPSCKSQSKQEQIRIFPGESCTRPNECLTESCSNQLDANSGMLTSEQVDFKDYHSSVNQREENLSREGSVLSQNELGLDTAGTTKVTSHETHIPHVDDASFRNEGNVGSSCKRPKEVDKDVCCEIKSLGEITETSSVDCSSSSLKCAQNANKITSNLTDAEEIANRRSVFTEEDSADDFQVSSVRATQSDPTLTQKPDMAKKRKGKKKSNNRTTARKRRTNKNNKELPTWSCSACTFINDGQLLECSICLTPRVTNEDSNQNTNDIEFGKSMKNNNDVEMEESRSFSLVQVDPKSIEFVGTIDAIQTDRSVGEMAGCSLLTGNDDIETTEVVPENTPVHGLSSESTERLIDEGNSTFLAEGGAIDESGLPSWSCSVCTFLNMSQMIECSICLTPRRRSQRHSTSKFSREDNGKKNKSSRKRRRKGDSVTKDEIKRAETLTRVDETNDGDSVTDVSLPSSENGLTPEPVESVHCDAEIEQNNSSVDNFAVLNDESSVVKSRPRKRLRLDNCTNTKTPDGVTEMSEFSDDSDNLWDNKPSTCALPDSACKNTDTLMEDIHVSSGGTGTSSSGDLVESNGVDKLEESYSIVRIRAMNRVNNDGSEHCGLLDITENSVDMNDSIRETPSVTPSSEIATQSVDMNDIERPLDTSSFEIAAAEDFISCSQGQAKAREVENLEELKAVAEEVFMSEWEDDEECWWEEESSSGQSSYPSSDDTTSSGPAVTKLNTGFTKCSDLYSLTDLKNKLQSTPEQAKVNTSTGVDSSPQFEPASGYKTSLAPIRQEINTSEAASEAASSVEEEELEDEPEEIAEPMKLKFCLSLYTERVYLYNEDDKPLGINFCMSDVLNGNIEDLPTILHIDCNLKQVKRFLGAWKRMGEGKKRILRKSALVFDDPLEAYEHARKGVTRESSYVRHPSKETQIQKVMDTAGEIGGNVRVVKQPRITTKKKNNRMVEGQKANSGHTHPTPTPSSSALSDNTTRESTTSSDTAQDKTCHQVVRADGIPLCLFCSGPVEFADKLNCSDWDKRFCSHDCKKDYQVRVSGTAARRALFEAERGVCQLCSLDAHSLFLSIRALHVRDRPAYLAQTPYASLPQQTLKKMVMEPKEGMFWEADHITPVSEGGGECGLENYRTLCIMCHRKATAELNRRLKQRKVLQYAAGYADISTFFRPQS